MTSFCPYTNWQIPLKRVSENNLPCLIAFLSRSRSTRHLCLMILCENKRSSLFSHQISKEETFYFIVIKKLSKTDVLQAQ